jgi:hypothetical protein
MELSILWIVGMDIFGFIQIKMQEILKYAGAKMKV